MKKAAISFLTIWTLIFANLLGTFVLIPEDISVSAITITVDDNGPADYTNIQDAINAANVGDTVFVYNGTYFENLVVNKKINLIGEDRDTTIIDSSGSGDVVYVGVDWVSLSGFTITGSGTIFGDAGIELNNVQNCKVFNNNASNNYQGIYIVSSSRNNITSNNAFRNNYYGIEIIFSSNNNTITGNNASNNNGGISIGSCSWNNLTGNIVSSNDDDGIRISSSSKNNLVANKISWNDWSGIYLTHSSENNIIGNDVSSNSVGIGSAYSSGDKIKVNNVSYNAYGIHLDFSTGSNITGNKMVENGIVISGDLLEYWNTHDIDTSNTVSGKPVRYLKNQTGGIVQLGAGQVILANCTMVKVENQQVIYGSIGIELGFSSNNNITGNIVSSTTASDISLYYSNGNNITGNTISSGEKFGMALYSSSGNKVSENIISSNDWYGLVISGSHGNNIIGNNISSNGINGVLVGYSSQNKFIGNNVSDNTRGIQMDSSSGNNLIGNNVSNNVWGVFIIDSGWNNITNNSLSNNAAAVILTSKSNNNTINNCTLNDNWVAISSSDRAHNNFVINSTILNSGKDDIGLGLKCNITVINTTFDKSKVNFVDSISNLTVKWYMHVNVKSTNSSSFPNVTVEVTNINNESLEGSPFTTGDDGFVRWITVTEYIQNDTNGQSSGGDNKIYFTPHKVTATFNESTKYAKPEPMMDSSKVVTIILDIEKPIADAGMDSSIDEDEPYMFDGSGSVDNTGIGDWTWDFGDGIFGYGETPTHTYTSSGFYVVVLNVTDPAGNWDADTVTLFVNNVPPTADAGSDKVGDEEEQIYFDGSNSIDTASDIDSLIYTWDFGDGTIGTGKMVNHSYDENGTYTVTLQVTDDDGTSSIDSITITINNTAPKITPIAPQFLQEDQIYTIQVIATDVKGDILTFSDNTTMFDIDPVTGVISFTPTNADVGTHLVNVTVVDDDGAESYLEIHMDIQNTNDAPIIITSPITIAVENSSYYYNLTVMDDDLDTITYTFDLKPDGMTIDSNGKITWTPTYQQASQTFMVIVNVSDGNDFDTQTFSITVMNVNDEPAITSTPILSAIEDAQYLYDVNAVDVDIGDRLIYSLDTAPLGMSIDSSTGLITWVPTNEQVGDNEVIVNVTDSIGAFATQGFSIIVSNANDAPVLEPIGPLIATEDQPFYYQAVATDIDVYDTLSFYDDYELFQIDEDTGVISFMPSNDDVGTYTLKIVVQDAEGAMDNETIIFMVLNVNDSPTLDFISDRELTEDLPFTLIVTASDMDSDDSITFLDNTTLFDINPYSGEISFTPTNEDVGTHLVNITVKDKSGSIAYQAVTFTVNNVNDPSMIEPIGGLTTVVGKAFSYTVMATDIDHGDTLTFSDDTEIFDIDPNTGEISFTPSEKDAGVHYVTITVTDEEGETNQTTVPFTILEAEAEEPFDYTWILLIIIVGLFAFFIGYFIRRKEERELPKEEGIEEPEEIEMELLEEEKPPEEEGEDLKKEIVKQPSEDEEIFEFETIEEEGEEGVDESADFEEEEQSKKDEYVEPKSEEEIIKEENTSGDKDSEESEE